MERLRPIEAMEPEIPASGGASALRATLYTALAIMLVAGVWVRFNSQIASVAPVLAGPAEAVADQLPGAVTTGGLLDVGLVPLAADDAAVAAMGLNAADTTQLNHALERKRIRLVHLPLLDVSPVLAAGSAGHSVEVSAGGYTRIVHLTRDPVTLTLPVGPAGMVTFRTTGSDPVNIGALTLSGPVWLPALPAGQTMQVGLIAQ